MISRVRRRFLAGALLTLSLDRSSSALFSLKLQNQGESSSGSSRNADEGLPVGDPRRSDAEVVDEGLSELKL